MDKIIFRKAILKDTTDLLHLEQQVIAAERPFNQTLKENNATYYDIESLLTEPASYLMVAELDGQVIGTGYAQIRASKQSLKHTKHSYLGFMYVAPEHRGKGLNKQLIDCLITWSKEQGVFDLYLDVYTDNDAAIRAYEKVGFVKSLVEMKINVAGE